MLVKDPRIQSLAHILLNHSVKLKTGEKILIDTIGNEIPLTRALIRSAQQIGAMVFIQTQEPELTRTLIEGCTKSQLEETAKYEIARMQNMDAYIGIRGGDNVSELAGISPDKMQMYMEHYMKPLHFETRVPKTKWCILRYPNHAMAQLANMDTESFEDFYFRVCTLDYAKMSAAMDALVRKMQQTEYVHILGKDTDLRFKIQGMPAIKCAGQFNIPDGEVFTAPIRDSVEGFISYNVPSLYQGNTYENIRLEFKQGKIIHATANNTEGLNAILDTDEGARYIGEFAIGLNPYIHHPMKDILFDEKINGSFHFTPGACYDECSNKNQSSIHWDMVCIQRPEYGGGEIYFDNVLVRKDGKFVIDDLEHLNPEHLI